VVESLDDVVYVGAIVQEANKIFIEEQTKEITTFCHHPGINSTTKNLINIVLEKIIHLLLISS
jgi:hypothetical protein